MKYIITEQQYQEYRKSIITRFLRRVSYILDEIIDNSIEHLLEFYPGKDLKHMGENGFSLRVVNDAFEYIYDDYIEREVEFSYDEQDIIRDYLHERYFNHIRDEYLTQLNKSNINESEQKKKTLLFQELIDETLEYIVDGCDKSYSEFPYDIYMNSCDAAEITEKIKILNVSKKEGGNINIDVKVEFRSINEYYDFNWLLENVSRLLNSKTGLDITIKEIETENINKDRQW